MTYEKLFELKFKKGYSTNELIEKFPEEAAKVREIALLQIPTSTLKRTVAEDSLLEKLLTLKRKFWGGKDKRRIISFRERPPSV